MSAGFWCIRQGRVDETGGSARAFSGLNRPYEHLQKTSLCMATVASYGRLDPAALDSLRASGANAGVDARHGPPSRGRAIC